MYIKWPFKKKFSPKQVLIAGGVIIVIGFLFFGRGEDLGATLLVEKGDFLQQVSVSGSVVASQDVALGFASSGRISGVYGKVGQHVSAGTILAETENGDLVATLSQKRSALLEAEADLAALKAGTRPEELAVAEASVVNAQAALSEAIRSAYTSSDDAIHNKVDNTIFVNPKTANPKLIFDSSNSALQLVVEGGRVTIETLLTAWGDLITNLSNENADTSAKQSQVYLSQVIKLLADINTVINQGIPNQTVTADSLSSFATTLATARSNVNSFATTLSSDLAELTSAKANLALKEAGATSETIVAKEAFVAAAEAEIQSARSALAKTRVVAPFRGIVTRMDAKVGEIVSPTTSLISMQSDGLFEVETYVPEVAISRIAVGNTATTTLDAYGSKTTFPTVVTAVDPAETMKDGVPAYKTTLSFLSADSRIRSGMTANVVIETGVLYDAIVIPSGAVGTYNSEVFVSLSKDGEVVRRAVVTGMSPALGQIEIVSGLSAGERILLTPVR